MKKQDLKRMEELLREATEISLSNNWNIHSAVGGKYGEVFVANALGKHGPLIGNERKHLRKEIRNPTSADVILSKTKKKVEVKWGILTIEKTTTISIPEAKLHTGDGDSPKEHNSGKISLTIASYLLQRKI